MSTDIDNGQNEQSKLAESTPKLEVEIEQPEQSEQFEPEQPSERSEATADAAFERACSDCGQPLAMTPRPAGRVRWQHRRDDDCAHVEIDRPQSDGSILVQVWTHAEIAAARAAQGVAQKS